MHQLSMFTRYIGLGFVTAIAVIFLLKLLLGKIPLSGLFTGDRRDGSEYLSLGRTLVFVCTVVIATSYVRKLAANTSLTTLPDVSSSTLEVLGASQFLYLLGKARALLSNSSVASSLKGE